MGTQQAQNVVVYRGTDVVVLTLVEDMLRAEGLEPVRLGRASPALLGVGIAAVEQLIAVPPHHADEARRLIAQTRQHKPAASEEADLESQAMGAGAAPDGALPEGSGLRPRTILAIAALVVLLLLLLR